MVKLPHFVRGDTLRADDLNQLARAVAELRGGEARNRAGHAVIGGHRPQVFRAAGESLLLETPEGAVTLEVCAGGWSENDEHTQVQPEVLERDSADAVGKAGEFLLDAHLEPEVPSAPLTLWKPRKDGQPVVVFERWDRQKKEEEAAAAPRRALARMVPQPAGGTLQLTAETGWYGRPQAAFWLKGPYCTNKEADNPTAAVLLPGPDWQTVFLQRASYYFKGGVTGVDPLVNLWSWGIQAQMDAFGRVSFRSVCRARGPYRGGH